MPRLLPVSVQRTTHELRALAMMLHCCVQELPPDRASALMKQVREQIERVRAVIPQPVSLTDCGPLARADLARLLDWLDAVQPQLEAASPPFQIPELEELYELASTFDRHADREARQGSVVPQFAEHVRRQFQEKYGATEYLRRAQAGEDDDAVARINQGMTEVLRQFPELNRWMPADWSWLFFCSVDVVRQTDAWRAIEAEASARVPAMTSKALEARQQMSEHSEPTGDSLPSRIWSVEDYYRAKDFYEKRGLVFNPALEADSPAAYHVIAQHSLQAARQEPGKNDPPSSPVRSAAAPSTAAGMPSVPGKNPLVFISYSHKDKRFLNELLAHLKPMERAGTVAAWSDKQIQPGSQWFEEIRAAVNSAKVALLLVTKDFLASDFIHEHELGPLLKQAEQGGVKILWVLVRACAYQETALARLQAVIPPDKPLAQMRAERDQAWVTICKAIKDAVNPR